MDDFKGHTTPANLEAIEMDNPRCQPDEGQRDATRDRRDMGTDMDRQDMARLGRTQEVKRRFQYFSMVGYMILLAATWESGLISLVFSLGNGGTGGAIWMTFGSSFGMFVTCLSMAEMASISPTAGGQVELTSLGFRDSRLTLFFASTIGFQIRFAPPSVQKPLSYAVGWLCTLGWQTAMPAISYTTALQIVALINTCNPEYQMHGWHAALLTIAVEVFAILFNIFAINKFQLIEGIVVIIHVFGFLAIIVIFWVMGPRTPANVTFLTFHDSYGWGSSGLATLVSVVGPVASLIGADAAVHLAEELKDAAKILPRAMVTSALINYATAMIMIITLVSGIGSTNNLDDLLSDPTGQPWVALVRRVTGSKAATVTLIVLVAFQFFFTAVNEVTTSSRQFWAFARDKGVPFHPWLSKVSETDGIPRNAVFVTLTTTCLLAMIIIGSTTAFNIILSVCNVALVMTYIICIGTFTAKRCRREKLPPAQFPLGKLGIWINLASLCWLAFLAVFLFFPAAPNPTAASMNWAIVIFGGVVTFAFVWYFVRGRHEYMGPVEYIRKDI
ncbi:hypothetical protein LTR22_026809 [Elasticomyces elasticus]|nr:hypothetical protein LTR22_026809 [Elasticomyces elasticus]